MLQSDNTTLYSIEQVYMFWAKMVSHHEAELQEYKGGTLFQTLRLWDLKPEIHS